MKTKPTTTPLFQPSYNGQCMKLCGKCKLEKPLEEFHKATRGSQGRHAYCKLCNNAARMELYHAKDGERVRRRATALEMRQWFAGLKAKPCTDCKLTYPPYVMEWDHLPQYKKLAAVTTLVNVRNKAAILEEIAKCELVCSNCHKERTYQRSLSSTE